MNKFEIHESLRIVIPGIFLSILCRILFPNVFPGDASKIALVGIFAGIIIWPILDHGQKIYFHIVVKRYDFYGKLSEYFSKHYNIERHKKGTTKSIKVFSGTLKNMYEVDAKII